MEIICEVGKCTGCGMCSNICPKGAINMKEGIHGFIFPVIDNNKCIDCNLCRSRCPSNTLQTREQNVKSVYAAWNNDKLIRKQSTSGGIFSALAKYVIGNGGVVCGVAWDQKYHPQHVIIDNVGDIVKLQGSKYSQSNTRDIYQKIKSILSSGVVVLFSGTPCQNAALKSYLGGDYQNLYLIDVVCHGVPSNKFLDDYYNLLNKKIEDIHLRYKDPYWDYTFVRVDFKDGSKYQKLTVDDDYFNLFNIGYSIRESCHNCQYASTHRIGDITLADFWGYTAHSFATRSYNKGTSCVLINSARGQQLFNAIANGIFYEEETIEKAIKGNKCLKESFSINSTDQNNFWNDYEMGMNIHELNEKYCARTFSRPVDISLRRLVHKYKWIIEK